MPLGIGAYALIGDRTSGALVGTDGSIDWLCLPRFDSASVFGAILGYGEHGEWRLAPEGEATLVDRAYEDGTVVLRSRWSTPTGEALVTDAMVWCDGRSTVVRRVEGLGGRVTMRSAVAFRFDYATAVPWLRRLPDDEGPG